MFAATPVQPLQQPTEAVSQPVDDKPQAKSKKEDTARLANEMINIAGYTSQLMLQSHLVHFNYEAGNFFGVHKFSKSQYKKHQEQFDRVGELIRSLDYLLPMCSKGLTNACKKFKHIDSYEPQDMLLTDLENLEAAGMQCKKVIKLAAKEDAPDVENYMAQLIEEFFTASWMIKATLRNKGSHCSPR